MTTRCRVFVSSRPFVACDDGEPKICKTRVTIRVDKDIVLSLREYCAARSEVK